MMNVLPYHGTQLLEIAIARPVRDPVRLGLRRLLDRRWPASSLLAARPRSLRDQPARAAPAARADRADARTAIVMPICNEDVRARVRRPARHVRVARAHRRARRTSTSSCCQRQRRSRHARRRARRVARPVPRSVDGLRAASSTAGASTASSARAATSPTSAGAGARSYRYMVVLDADSVMTRRVPDHAGAPDGGASRRRHHPDRAARRRARHAATRASSSSRPRVYGPLFTAGLHFWQLGESHYWGHNAIIRVAPFMRHCALGRLPGQRRAVGRDPVARLRRGGADAPRRLGGLDRLRPRRQLRGDAARTCSTSCSATAAGARATCMNSRLFAEHGPASGAPRRVHDRRDGVPVGAAVVRVPGAVDASCSRCTR